MLVLKINDIPLHLDPGLSLTINMLNPALEAQRVGRTYSYPVRVPLAPATRVNLQHQHRLDSRINQEYIPDARIEIEGQPFDKGRALVLDHTESNSQLAFQNEDLSLYESLGDINIRDLVGTITIPANNDAYYALAPSAGPLYQIYINEVLYQGGGLGIDKIDAMIELVSEINAVFPGIAFYSGVDDEFRLTTSEEEFRLSFVQFTLVTEITLADARELNLQEYITTLIATPSDAISFPVVANPGLYGNLNLRYRNYINWQLDGTYITNGHYAQPTWEVTYIPFVKLRYLLDLIAEAVGLTAIIFDTSTDEADDLDSVLLYNNYTLDELRLEYYLSADPTAQIQYKNGFATEITLANHIPDWTAETLINNICEFFNLHRVPQNNRLYLRKNVEQIKAPALNWTNRTDPRFERTSVTGGGVTLRFAADTDRAVGGQLSDYIVGDGYNVLQLAIKPMYMSNSLPNYYNDNIPWKVPYIDQPGTSPALDLETETEALRIFFDRGQQEDEDGGIYWLGSIDNLDYNNSSVGELSLEWIVAEDDNGLYSRFWRGWTGLLFSPQVTRVCQLDINILIALRQWRHALVYIYHEEGAILAVVRSLRFKVATDRSIGLAEVVFQKLQ